MSLPVVELQIAETNTPRDGDAVTWVSQAGLLKAHVSRGRSHLAQRFEAGTLDVELENAATSEVYDPAYFGSGARSPLRPCRLLIDGITEFNGFVESWEVARKSQARSMVQMRAVDLFKLLSYRRLRDTAYRDYIGSLGPNHYYRLEEKPSPVDGTFSGMFADSTGGTAAQQRGAMEQVTDGPLVTDPSPGVRISGSSFIHVPTTGAIGTYPAFTFTCWMRTSSVGVAMTNPLQFSPETTPLIAQMQVELTGTAPQPIAGWFFILNKDANGKTFLTHWVSDGVTVDYCDSIAGVTVNDGKWHFVALTRDSAGTTMRIYIDGQVAGAFAVAGTLSNSGSVSSIDQMRMSANAKNGFQTGYWSTGPAPNDYGLGTAQVDLKDVAYWDNVELTASDILGAYNRGIWPAETVADRLNRCCDLVGVPGSWRNFDTGHDLVAYTDPLHHTSALEHMQLVVDSDAGELFVSQNRVLTFLEWNRVAPASAGTFSDKANVGAGEIPYEASGGPRLDDADIYNEISVTGPGFAPILLTDATSDTDYGTRSFQLSNCQLAIWADAYNVASLWLAILKNPTIRLAAISYTVLNNSGAAHTQALARDLMDRITVKQYGPTNAGTPYLGLFWIEHIDQAYQAGGPLVVTYALSAF